MEGSFELITKFSSREGVRALGPPHFGSLPQVRSPWVCPAVSTPSLPTPGLLHFRRAGKYRSQRILNRCQTHSHTEQEGRRIQIPWDPKHTQSRSAGGSRSHEVPNIHTVQEDPEPPVPLLCPPSFNHTALLFLMGQAFSLRIH